MRLACGPSGGRIAVAETWSRVARPAAAYPARAGATAGFSERKTGRRSGPSISAVEAGYCCAPPGALTSKPERIAEFCQAPISSAFQNPSPSAS